MIEQIVGQLSLDIVRYLVTVLAVAIHDAKEKASSFRVFGHDKCVLVLFLGIIGRVPFLGIPTIRVNNEARRSSSSLIVVKRSAAR